DVHLLAKKLGQTGLLSQCHHRDQPGTRHEVVVVEHRRISHEVVRHLHRKCLSQAGQIVVWKLQSSQLRRHFPHINTRTPRQSIRGSRFSVKAGVAAGYGGVAGTDDVAPTQCPGRPGAASDGPAHAQPAPYRTNPVVVDDRVTGPTHSAPRIRPRTLNPLTSHELSRLPMRAPIIDSRKKWTNSWRPATRPPAT